LRCPDLFISGFFTDGQDIPILDHYVNDSAGIPTSNRQLGLKKTRSDFDKSTSNQIVVLTTYSLWDNDLQEFGRPITQKNRIGTMERNYGILILIALTGRKMRVHVGSGMEKCLTCQKTTSMIGQQFKPSFQRGNYFDGLNPGIKSLMGETRLLYD